MKKMVTLKAKKKTISILLTLALCLGLIAPVGLAPPTASAELGTTVSEWDFINFGRYRHIDSDGNYEEDPSDILWMVVDLDEAAGTARLISYYVLDEKAMDPNAPDGAVVPALGSPLAAWLDEEFRSIAFSSFEQSFLMYYDAQFQSDGATGGGYPGPSYAIGGTQVSFLCFYYDCFYKSSSRPLGNHWGSGSYLDIGLLATYKDKQPADYWAATGGAVWHGNVAVTLDTDVPFPIRDQGVVDGVMRGDAGPGYEIYANDTSGVRPMIKVDLNDMELTGTGTIEDPFEVVSSLTPGTALRAGDYINLGQYAHIDSQGAYESELTDITWLVFELGTRTSHAGSAVGDGTARLVSHYVLDMRHMDADAAPNTSVSSIHSPLAQWMDSDFKDTAFTAFEKSLLRYYGGVFFAIDETGGNYANPFLSSLPDTLVSFVDFFSEGWFRPSTEPLGMDTGIPDPDEIIDFVRDNTKMAASFKDGVYTTYWTGTVDASNRAAHHVPTNTLLYGYNVLPANQVTGVRPAVRIDFTGMMMKGAGTLEDPYVVSNENQIEVFTVSFETNGGTSLNPVRVQSGARLNVIGNTVRYGYTLSGWYKDSGLTELWNQESDVVTSDMTLYAAWEDTGSHKTRSILYPESFAYGARTNAQEPWAAPIYDQIMKDVEHYNDLTNDDMWNIMFPHTIQPRELMVSAYGRCPSCDQPNLIYAWEMDAKTIPWKVRCPHDNCLELFPKNDFLAFYLSGIDPATGIYQPDLANRNLLFNEECADAGGIDGGLCMHGNPFDSCQWGVDDGTSYRGTLDGAPYRWFFIGAYLYRGQWHYALDAVNTLSSAYMVTGDVTYARKAAIVLDRIADLFPHFEYRSQGFVYEQSTSTGYVTYSIDSAFDVRILAEAYDMIFDAIKGDAELVTFLQGKAQLHPQGIAPKDSFNDVQRNIEARIFMDAINNPGKLFTNYPNTDITIAIVRCVLNLPGAQDDAERILGDIIETATRVDGLTGEKGLPNYSSTSIHGIATSIAKFMAVDESLLGNLLITYPSLYETYEFFADLWYDGIRYPLQGDGGWFAQQIAEYRGLPNTQQGTRWLYTSALAPSMFTYLWNFYQLTGDTMFIKIMYNSNGKSVDGLPHDIMYPDPAALQEYVADVIAREGSDLSRGNVNKTDWAIAMLRSNEQRSGPAAWLNYQSVGSHGHGDALNLGLFAYGYDLMPDLGYPPVGYQGGWMSPQAAWNVRPYSHNLVLVDKEDFGADDGRYMYGQLPSKGTTTLWEEGEFHSAIRVDQKGAYSATSVAGGRYERTVVLIDIDDKDAYLFDVFRVAGGNEHARMMSSTVGDMTTAGLNLSEATFLGELPILTPIVSNEKADENPGFGFSVTWNVQDLPEPWNYDLDTDIFLRHTDLTNDVSMVVTFDAWTKYGSYDTAEETITSRFSTVRQGSGDLTSTFVGIIEPFKGSSNIANIRRLALTDGNGDPLGDSFVAVEITFTSGAKDLIIAADPLLFNVGDVMIADGWEDYPATSDLTVFRIKLISVSASAFVTKLNGNQNDLTITVTQHYSDGSTIVFKRTLKINNNAAGTYAVGPYWVYVDTKGNDQIRACYIID